MRRTVTAILATALLVASVSWSTTPTSYAYVGSALSSVRTWGISALSGSATALGFAPAAAAAADATVSTDKADYAPGETALISGSGFAAGEDVTLQVAHVTGETEAGAGHESWTVVAEESGSISSSWYVNPDDSLGATLLLTAVGASGARAEWTFTDGPPADPTDPGPPSGDGIVPVLILGNSTCGVITDGAATGEAKIEPVSSGTYLFGGVSVTLTVINTPSGPTFNWTSTLGVTSVFAKGGNAGNHYVYPSEDNGDTSLHSPINPSNGTYYGLSHVSFCYDKDLTVKKTAATTLDRTHTWTIDKAGDATYSKFIGDAASSNPYTVNVDQTVTDSNWAVGGTITIVNDTPVTATLTGVSDIVSGAIPIPGTVTCPGTFPQALASGATLSCSYSAALPDPADRTNTATAETSGDVLGGSGSAAVSFASAVVSTFGYPTVNVADTNGGLGAASDDFSWAYAKDFACSTNKADYANGSYSFTHVNTATITETGQSDTATVKVNCYAPVVSKTAATSYNRDHQWTIDKSVAPDSLSGFIGGSAGSATYTIKVDLTETESGFTVAGSITVTNPNPSAAMNVSLTDSLDGATLSCAGSLSVPAGDSATCDYSAGRTSKDNGTNTATATLNSIDFSADAAYSFDNAAVTVTGEPTIHVSDSNGQGSEGPFSADGTITYDSPFNCSANAGSYTDGVDVDVYGNVATIDETGADDDASVTVSCYAPSVSKTAATSYTRKHEWTIDKSVTTQSSFTGFPGQGFDFGYKVYVDEAESEYDFKVSGAITVNNPHPTAPMSVSVSDPGATLDCGGSLTVPANSSASCSYVQPLDTKTNGENTATASINNVDFTASALYAFGEPTTVVGPPTINVTDTNPAGGPWSTSDDRSWAYTVTQSCSTDTASYTNGVDTDVYPNTATITETDAPASANVTMTCYIPAKANVVKTTTEGPDPFGDSGFTFSLELGGTSIETASTIGAGSVAFVTDLTVEGAYSVIEALPAGWYNDTLSCGFTVDYPGSAGQVYECAFHNREAGRATVIKLTDGAVDSNMTWKFAIFEGAHDACGTAGGGSNCASFLSTPIASDGTFEDLDGLLQFASVNLDPSKQYTMCETNVAAGWSSQWLLDLDLDGTFDLSTEV
ncbi:MAG: hypothetical protein RJA55_1045 [Acidobacteriota bacterium]|jgi:hypothetical protein